MSRAIKLTEFLVAALLASPALAQDSVSPNQGLPGDALDAYSTTEQRNTYVVDMTSFTTSWGTRFGIAPIIKASSHPAGTFFTNLISGQAISNNLKVGVPFAFSTYDVWSGQGDGINDSENTTPGTVGPVAPSVNQFAVTFSEFGGSSNVVIGGIVNYSTADPSRLYVARIGGAINGDTSACNLAQVGTGSVDSDGNVHFRVDGNGTAACGGRTNFTGNNYLRVNLPARTASVLNVLNNTNGASDTAARTWLVMNSGTTHNTPTTVPNSIAGRPIIVGTDFSAPGRYIRESAPGVTTSDSSHFDPAVTDQRGNPGYTHHNFPVGGTPSTNGVAGTLAKTGGSGSPTETQNIFGIGANGVVTGTLAVTLPASNLISDPCSGFSPANSGPGQNEFIHYFSQTPFRGGPQLALGVDQDGNLLTAAVAAYPSIPAMTSARDVYNFNYIAVSRTTPAGVTSWTIAAHSLDDLFASRGKAILDGPGGNVIGYLTSLNLVTGGTPFGPSIAPPMIDSVGNIYFLAAAEILRGGFSDFDTALIRAVYNPSAFCYELELVFDVGTVFAGRNSATNYQIRFMEIADSNSLSSSTAFSANVNQSAHRGIDPSGLPTSSPDTLGGLVLQAEIVYDVNGDGNYVKVTGAGGDPLSPDQEYTVLLYVGSVTPDPEVACRTGNVNAAAGPITDVFFLNNSAGNGVERRIDITPTTPFQLRMVRSPAGGNGRHAAYVWRNGPTPATVRNLPSSVGTICMPTPLSPGPPQAVRLANNTGIPQLGTENWPGPPTQPAPSTLLNLPAGINRTGTFFFQGIIFDPGSLQGQVAVTNGFLVVSQ